MLENLVSPDGEFHFIENSQMENFVSPDGEFFFIGQPDGEFFFIGQPDGEWFLPLGSGFRPTASIDPEFEALMLIFHFI